MDILYDMAEEYSPTPKYVDYFLSNQYLTQISIVKNIFSCY